MNDKTLSYSSTNTISIATLCVNMFMFMGLACFTLSLFLPVFFTSGEDIYGYWVLIIGWIGLVFIQFAWYANPINLLALLLARDNPRIALLLSCLAVMLASGAFIFNEIPTGINYEKVFIKEFGLGFYIWYAAQVFFLLALLSRFVNSVKNRWTEFSCSVWLYLLSRLER